MYIKLANEMFVPQLSGNGAFGVSQPYGIATPPRMCPLEYTKEMPSTLPRPPKCTVILRENNRVLALSAWEVSLAKR